MKTKKSLSWCDKCNENSMMTKIYTRKKDGKLMRYEICINISCGDKQYIPFPEDYKDKWNKDRFKF